MPLIAVILGSQSDAAVMEPCLQTLAELGIDHEQHVISAHRTPDKVREFAASAADRGFEAELRKRLEEYRQRRTR